MVGSCEGAEREVYFTARGMARDYVGLPKVFGTPSDYGCDKMGCCLLLRMILGAVHLVVCCM
jgi:hypothetical protein